MDMSLSATQAKTTTYPAVPERFYVFMNEKDQYLCTTLNHVGLFWSDRLEWAVRGKNPRKVRDCAKSIEPEIFERFVASARACIVDVSEKYPRRIEPGKTCIYVQEIHIVAAKERSRFFHGVTSDGMPTVQLSRAIGVPAQSAKENGEGFFAHRYVVAKCTRPAASLIDQKQKTAAMYG